MKVGEAFELISRAIETNHVPGGYLVVGDTRRNCRELTDLLLEKLYPGAEEQVRTHTHPDVAVLEPEGKSRTIKAETMRERIIAPMTATSFSGGWKIGIIYSADRLQPVAANAFLKSLEEPTPKTLFLLLTDQPDAIMPTIISRCQRIDLERPSGLLEGEVYDAVAKVFGTKGLDGSYAKGQAARFLTEKLAEAKDAVEAEEVAIVRKAFFMTIMSFVRKWMVEGSVPRHLAYRSVEAVEEAIARCERYIPEEAVISFMMDKITFPAK
ncbi:MAG: hypothetical protein E7049_12490 [Lentisphaerae bacterium]|jgi:hypothetical protein|nr:hypothetical protein [Lentisphaerota bacterium]